MRSNTLIFILTVAVAVSLLGLLFFALGGGFGGRGHGMGGMIPRSFALVMIGAPLIVVVGVVGYALVFPEISEKKLQGKPSSLPPAEKGESALDAVLRVLNEDERKAIETLVAAGGTMLQKEIRWKTGLSRVKTHRVLHRLAQRGIVSAEKYYNTNKITLADWLMKDKRNVGDSA